MPELPANFLLTERLEKLHAAMDASRVVSVCAPAGYGKTTLAVSYFNRRTTMPWRICWYRTNQEDRNLSVFIAHLTETLFPPDTALFVESRQVLQEYADGKLLPQQAVAMICQEMWFHHNRSATRTFIVLDDFQNVSQTLEIRHIVSFLLDNLPPCCRFLILNRTNYQVFSEKQRLEQAVLEVGSEDLSFSLPEVNAYLSQSGQSPADQALAAYIQKKTEGWIAGVVILGQAIKIQGSDITALKQGLPGHEDVLFKYLSLEVLQTIDSDTQAALARLALLQDFTETEAVQIFGIMNIQELLVRSMGLGVFIRRINGDPVVYRYNSLFREFLFQILTQRCSAEQLAELHLKAAAYYLGTEAYDRAADHLLKYGNGAISKDTLEDNPLLHIYRARLLPTDRQEEMLEPLKKLLGIFHKDHKPGMYFHVATVLIYIYICGNNMNGLNQMTSNLSWQLEMSCQELKNTLAILDMVQSIARERFPVAAAQSESVPYELLPGDSQGLYLVLSAIIYHCLGKLDEAEHCMEAALVLRTYKNSEPARGFTLLFLGIVLSLKNNKDRLPSLIAEIIAIGEKYNYDYLTATGRRLAAWERYLCFDTKAALKMLDYAVFHFRRMNNQVMAAACRLLKHLWSVQPDGTGIDLE